MILITILLIVFLGVSTGSEEAALALALLLGVFMMQRNVKNQIGELQQQIDQLKRQQSTSGEKTTSTPAAESIQPKSITRPVVASSDAQKRGQLEKPVAAQSEWPPSIDHNQPQSLLEEKLKQGLQWVISWFTDGNVFVRVGLLVLFVGVAFLLKYVAENSRIPLEFRYLAAASGGLALIIMGWRLRVKKAIFALLLQGGGIGIIYITIFSAYRIAELIPAQLTFVLLVLFALITAALAVMQNSQALALYAVAGGFVAPFLADSGSGNYIGLFSYYVLLNLLVFSIAWFRSWRPLNLVGFVFTFAAYGSWFALSYRPEMLLSAGLFLLLFFIMYSLLGILYALKQSLHLRGLVDGTLVFGTPLISSSLGMVMLRELDYGIAACSLALGLYYVLLARFVWRRMGEQTRLLAEAMLAIGVVFVTLAIPYALDGHWSSAAWALEATGILWVSLRQKRRYAQFFALFLQLGAGLQFLLRNSGDPGQTAFMNTAFLGGLFIALGALISARLLYLLAKHDRLQRSHWLFYAWGMGWWLMSSLLQIEHYLDNQRFAILLLFSGTSALLFYVDRIRHWNWLPASIQQALLLVLLYVLAFGTLLDEGHLLIWPDLCGWLAALALCYFMFLKLEQLSWRPSIYISLYTGLLFLLSGTLSIELYWRFKDLLTQHGEAYTALLTVVPLLAVSLVRSAQHPLFKRFGRALKLSMSTSLFAVLIGWSLVSNLTNDGSTTPLPYIPVLNALDLAQLVIFMSLLRSLVLLDHLQQRLRSYALALLGGLAFMWISAMLLRAMHHYTGVPFDLPVLLSRPAVQTGLSILWTLTGMLAILFASRRSIRSLWISGAVLVGLVILKLVITDLHAIGTVERIISFLVVGGLLVAMGYFSPIPPKRKVDKPDTGDSAHA